MKPFSTRLLQLLLICDNCSILSCSILQHAFRTNKILCSSIFMSISNSVGSTEWYCSDASSKSKRIVYPQFTTKTILQQPLKVHSSSRLVPISRHFGKPLTFGWFFHVVVLFLALKVSQDTTKKVLSIWELSMRHMLINSPVNKAASCG